VSFQGENAVSEAALRSRDIQEAEVCAPSVLDNACAWRHKR